MALCGLKVPRTTGREGPLGENRFSDREFDRAAVAFAVVALHTDTLDDTAAACTATTLDNKGRF